MREHTKLLLINEPYNPAGTLMSRERQAQLVAVAARRGVYILSDEIYRLLEHDPADRIPAMADLYERGEHRSLQPHAPSLQPLVCNPTRLACGPGAPSLLVTPRAQGSAWGRSRSHGEAAVTLTRTRTRTRTRTLTLTLTRTRTRTRTRTLALALNPKP